MLGIVSTKVINAPTHTNQSANTAQYAHYIIMSEPYIVGIIALAGTGLGALIMYAAAARTARIEERKHFRELGLKIALTKFESCVKSAQAITDLTGQPSEVPHFEIFVIEGIKLMEIVQSEPNIGADEIGRRIKRLRDFTKNVIISIKEKTDA